MRRARSRKERKSPLFDVKTNEISGSYLMLKSFSNGNNFYLKVNKVDRLSKEQTNTYGLGRLAYDF